MKAELKFLHSPDVHDLPSFVPTDECFSVFVQAMIGPSGEDTYESFDFVVCTAAWLASRGVFATLGRHHLIVATFDYPRIEEFVRAFCAACSGDDWETVARRLGALGRWEFDDYRE